MSLQPNIESMCGRTSFFPPALELETRFDASIAEDADYQPRYNIPPGTHLEVITNEAPDTIDQHHWGLLPSWTDDVDDGLINARSETADEKNAFRDDWHERPCLVLSSGFYEWQSKQPYRFYREDPAFAMAGLWEETSIDDRTVRSVTILTTEPNDLVASIHERMPVILPADQEDAWITETPERRRELCRPYPNDDLAAYAIDTRVNNPANDAPRILEKADRSQSDIGDFGA